MNEYKQQWMEFANAIIPKTIKTNSQTNQVEMAWDNPLIGHGLHKPIVKTLRSIELGMGLAATDGPLPIMDVVGFTVMTYGATSAWFEYFS